MSVNATHKLADNVYKLHEQITLNKEEPNAPLIKKADTSTTSKIFHAECSKLP